MSYRLNLHVGSCDPTVHDGAVHQNTSQMCSTSRATVSRLRQAQHQQASEGAWPKPCWCVCACGNIWFDSSSIYLVKQPILLPKLVRDYLFVTLATPSSCFTFSALGALLREGEKAVIDRATQVAKWKHVHWRTTRNKEDLLSWTSLVHLGYRCVGLFW